MKCSKKILGHVLLLVSMLVPLKALPVYLQASTLWAIKRS